jgi:hypothetical protein
VPLKSTEHHSTGTGPEEVKEEPMTTARAQEQQRQVVMRAQKKNGVSSFFIYLSTLLLCCKGRQKESHREITETMASFSLSLSLSLFYLAEHISCREKGRIDRPSWLKASRAD